MKLLAYVHAFPPTHNAGAELMLHSMLRWMVQNGHGATVLCSHGVREPYEYEGVQVDTASPANIRKLFPKSDVILTHLDRTHEAVLASRRHQRPLVHIVHNDAQLKAHGVEPKDAQLVVFNSRWVAAAHRWTGPYIVMPPPVFADDYRVKNEGDAVTLVNLTVQKGALTFFRLALDEPHRRFVGVLGGYGQQHIPDVIPNNVEIWQNSPDMKKVYSNTRVLLMPSTYESWGRCAIEAAASGIPTIAGPTPGLKESLGMAALFAVPGRVTHWRQHLRRLDSPRFYERFSTLARARSDALDPEPLMVLFEKRLQAIFD